MTASPDKQQTIDHILALPTWSMEALLLLRLVLDRPAPGQDIHQDLRDLIHYPERLNHSYRAEWTSYIKRDLYRHGFNAEGPYTARLAKYIEQRRQQVGEQLNDQWAAGVACIEFARQVDQGENVSVFPLPLKQWLKALLR